MTYDDWKADIRNESGSAPEDEAEYDGATCYACGGEGGYHDCGEDCCVCLDKEEITETCEVCGGRGWIGGGL